MRDPPCPRGPAASNDVAAARHTLARLREQAGQMRAELTQLRQALAASEQALSATHAGLLLQANEQLVLAAVRAQTEAESAAGQLQALTQSSQRDALTGIPNRVLMFDRLQKATAHARRHRTRMAVLFLDLDEFKQINDTLGHARGDEVLQWVARRLESVVRDSDTVSRHSGDEFLVLLADVSQPADAALIADKILISLAGPARIGEHALRIAASVGIALYPDDGEAASTLIERADAAMYRAKRRGRGRIEFYSA